MTRTSVAPISAEGKCVGLHAGIEEPDLERVIGDNALPDELIKPLPGHDAPAVGIDIRAAAGAGWRAVDSDAESDRLTVRPRSENQMQIARVEPGNDTAVFLVEDGMLSADRPFAHEPPFIEPGHSRHINVRVVVNGAAWRDKILRTVITDVGLRRLDVLHVSGGLRTWSVHSD